jgi:hypothetical protein
MSLRDQKFAEDTVVLVSGLSSRPDLNGSIGKVLYYVAVKERYAVEMTPEGVKLLLRDLNLCKYKPEVEECYGNPVKCGASQAALAKQLAGMSLEQREQIEKHDAKERAHASQSGDAYDKSIQHVHNDLFPAEAYGEAKQVLAQLIRDKPERPDAFFSLGWASAFSNDVIGSTTNFMAALERHEEGTTGWSECFVRVYDGLCQTRGARPSWWNDAGLKRLSALAVRALRGQINESLALRTRAQILMAHVDGAGEGQSPQAHLPPVSPRTKAELEEATRCFARWAALATSTEEKKCALHNEKRAKLAQRQRPFDCPFD